MQGCICGEVLFVQMVQIMVQGSVMADKAQICNLSWASWEMGGLDEQ